MTHLPGAAAVQGHALVPLVHVVRVLAQQDAVEEQRPPADELLKAGQAQLQVHVVWGPRGPGGRRASVYSHSHLPARAPSSPPPSALAFRPHPTVHPALPLAGPGLSYPRASQPDPRLGSSPPSLLTSAVPPDCV